MKFEWIFPIVIVIVWLLNRLLRGRENDEAIRPPRSSPTRPPSSNVERFLEEIERLRKRAATEASAQSQTKGSPSSAPQSRLEGQALQAERQPQTRLRLSPVAAPSAIPDLPSLESATQKLNSIPPVGEVLTESASNKSTGGTSRSRSGNRKQRELSRLLRSKDAIGNAILLQEILGKPRSLRPR